MNKIHSPIDMFYFFNPMYTVTLRYLRQIKADIGKLVNLFYWPFLDIVVWGFTAQWMQQGYTSSSNLLVVVLTVMIAWQLVARSSLDISTMLLDDILDNNLINMFATPLSLWQWASGVFLLSVINVTALLVFATMVVFIFYHFNIFSVGIAIVPFLVSLFLAGLSVGFFSAGILVYFGRSFLGIMYMMGWFFTPFSGTFYPIEVLPNFFKVIAQLLPFSYATTGIRLLVERNVFSWKLFCISFFVAAIYMVLTFSFFLYMFVCSKRKGLARLSE